MNILLISWRSLLLPGAGARPARRDTRDVPPGRSGKEPSRSVHKDLAPGVGASRPERSRLCQDFLELNLSASDGELNHSSANTVRIYEEDAGVMMYPKHCSAIAQPIHTIFIYR